MMKTAGSGSESGSVSQRHESADPDPNPYQYVMDPQYCNKRGHEYGENIAINSVKCIVFNEIIGKKRICEKFLPHTNLPAKLRQLTYALKLLS
jgi:hypothetical protein